MFTNQNMQKKSRKFGMKNAKEITTLMVINTKLDNDLKGKKCRFKIIL